MYSYIAELNEVMEVRRLIPENQKQLRESEEILLQLRYEVERFERPVHLMELSRKAEFGHLYYPYLKDIVILYAPEIEASE